MTPEELNAQRDALLAARYRGVRTVEIDGRLGPRPCGATLSNRSRHLTRTK
jgi:hypothetical protein